MRAGLFSVKAGLIVSTLLALIGIGSLFYVDAAENSSHKPHPSLYPAPVTIDGKGTMRARAFDMPFSSFASNQARSGYVAGLPQNADAGKMAPEKVLDIAGRRKLVDEQHFLPLLTKQTARWGSTVETVPTQIAGVYTEVFSPRQIPARNKHRILINVHGGGMMWGARTGGRLESLPIAGVGQIRVVSIDYRMAPEHRFPAASEDVAAVYVALLQDYKPESIGVFGCSAGGILTGEVVAWLIDKKLPLPAAVGMFGGTGYIQLKSNGDSAHLAYSVYATSPTPADALEITPDSYFAGVDLDAPLVSPLLHDDVVSRFPPSLLLSGARSFEASALINANNRLALAGVQSYLHLWDGLGHCFYQDPDIPESHEAEKIIVAFFDKHLR
jgi:epsilon-lactone hydrolase